MIEAMKCVILAAGEGKRMRPLTAKRPKVMLPLVNRPMMEYPVLAVRDAGIKNFVFVVGYQDQIIRDYFGDGTKFGIHIQYAFQPQQSGTADALSEVKELVSGTFLLRSKQQKARDFSHGMNASSYQPTRSIISMASV